MCACKSSVMFRWIVSSSDRFHSWKEPVSKMHLSILQWLNVCFSHKVIYLLNKYIMKKIPSYLNWKFVAPTAVRVKSQHTREKLTLRHPAGFHFSPIKYRHLFFGLFSSGGSSGASRRVRWKLTRRIVLTFAGAAVWFPGADRVKG